MDLFEAMDSNRAMRRLKPDPVPRELLERLVHAATRAPSAGNSQLWGFVVVTDRGDMAFLAEIVRRRLAARGWPRGEDRQARMMRAVRHLIEHFAETPAVILCCVRDAYPSAESPEPQFMWSTIYPAAQNLLLAARALGLGAAMTTFHLGAEDEIRRRFGVPDDVRVGATVPVGYPRGRFGPLGRRPLAEVLHWGRWGGAA